MWFIFRTYCYKIAGVDESLLRRNSFLIIDQRALYSVLNILLKLFSSLWKMFVLLPPFLMHIPSITRGGCCPPPLILGFCSNISGKNHSYSFKLQIWEILFANWYVTSSKQMSCIYRSCFFALALICLFQ